MSQSVYIRKLFFILHSLLDTNNNGEGCSHDMTANSIGAVHAVKIPTTDFLMCPSPKMVNSRSFTRQRWGLSRQH